MNQFSCWTGPSWVFYSQLYWMLPLSLMPLPVSLLYARKHCRRQMQILQHRPMYPFLSCNFKRLTVRSCRFLVGSPAFLQRSSPAGFPNVFCMVTISYPLVLVRSVLGLGTGVRWMSNTSSGTLYFWMICIASLDFRDFCSLRIKLIPSSSLPWSACWTNMSKNALRFSSAS